MSKTSRSIERIFEQRADNYAHHFACREEVRKMSDGLRDLISHAAGHLLPPSLTVFGSTGYTLVDHRALILLAKQIGMEDPFLINPWYVSDAGWKAFQAAWDELPEPVDFLNRKLSTSSCG